jgi:hypothetical protein
MRIDEAFILGAVTGAAAMWLWGPQIADSIESRTRELRTAAADSIQVIEETIRPGAATRA